MRQLSPETRAALRAVEVIIGANRGPFAWRFDDPAHPEIGQVVRSEGGGLLTAMYALAEATDAAWVASASGERDGYLANAAAWGRMGSEGGPAFRMSYVAAPPAAYEQFYNVIANPLLWFIQHYLWDVPTSPLITDEVQAAWDEGYTSLNRLFAGAIVQQANASVAPPVVLLQDYHFYLAPAMIREARPDAVIQHFVHIPWPDGEYWKILPRQIREDILKGLLGNDIVGFQTAKDARNFIRCCEDTLGLPSSNGVIAYSGRAIRVRDYPISVDVDAMTALANDPATLAHRAEIQSWRPERLVVRVDRMDPSKNIVRGFLAFERMLERHPEERGRTQHVAFLQPTRGDVQEYRDYRAAVEASVARINARVELQGPNGELPIRLEVGQDMTRMAAFYAEYDVLLVNSVHDGMNLVSKEGPLCNRRDGVLLLSEFAGANQELGRHALTVHPYHVDETARALHTGLTMSLSERRERITAIRDLVTRNDLTLWLERMVADIAVVLAERTIGGRPPQRGGLE